MYVGFHGGKCCGVKTIWDLDEKPSYDTFKRSEKEWKSPDSGGHEVSSKEDMFHEGAPEETCEKRLDRYIAYLKKWRPQGIIEITTAQGAYTKQTDNWREVLEARGFKKSISAMNSNSLNIVTVWHMAYDAKEEAKKEYDKAAQEEVVAEIMDYPKECDTLFD